MGTVTALVAVVGWLAAEGGGVVPTDASRDAPAQAGGLAGLSSALNGTGRIAQMQVQGAGVDGASAVSSHGDVVVKPLNGSGGGASGGGAQPDPIGEPQMERINRRVEECRIEVARRRGITPANVPASAVTVRWTIETNGRVRDAEAVRADDTDLEVAACAKRVISEWAFGKPTYGASAVERTFKF